MPGIDYEALEDEWEDDGPRRPDRRRGLANYSSEAKERVTQHGTARVVGLGRGSIDLVLDGEDEIRTGTYAGSMRGTRIAVGDEVRVRPPKRATDVARVVELLERTTELTRTPDDTEDEERVVVANVEQVAVVIAADNLESGLRFADRVLVAASAGGITPIVVVNRSDLVEGLPTAQVADRFRHQDLATHVTSAVTGAGVEELRAALIGRWTAFTGHSGVGKSTLTNALEAEAEQPTGELGTRGGRHTTVAARAIPLRGGGWLVDTPGVRSFGLGRIDVDDLRAHFPELAGLECEIDGCTHAGEPGCGIDQADIHPERLASFLRLREALSPEL